MIWPPRKQHFSSCIMLRTRIVKQDQEEVNDVGASVRVRTETKNVTQEHLAEKREVD